MFKFTLTKLVAIQAALETINHAGWTGRYNTPALEAMAEATKDRLYAKAYQCQLILDVRYGLNVWDAKPEDVAALASR